MGALVDLAHGRPPLAAARGLTKQSREAVKKKKVTEGGGVGGRNLRVRSKYFFLIAFFELPPCYETPKNATKKSSKITEGEEKNGGTKSHIFL
jgi:hypothetical protein